MVRRLKAAGAIVLAKTNTPEFACGANTNNALFGATRNPWNPVLSPAGSSGGSAVAVATGMVPIAQGTDFGGSIRIPAAFCGIVGLRPTPGLVPNHPMPLVWDPGQVHGALARDAEDAALHARRYGRLQPPVADLGRAAMDERACRNGTPRRRRKTCALPMRRHRRPRPRCRNRTHLPQCGAQASYSRRHCRRDRFRRRAMDASPIRRGAACGWSASNTIA